MCRIQLADICSFIAAFALSAPVTAARPLRVTIDSISTTDSKRLFIHYTVLQNELNQPLLLNVSRSSRPSPGGHRVLIVGANGSGVTLTGDDATTGPHTVEVDPQGTTGATYVFSQPDALRPDLRYRYVLVEFTPPGKRGSEPGGLRFNSDLGRRSDCARL
jgi:hypothetical protein